MTLYYEIKFYDYWHLSSGLSAGAQLDSSVIKDENFLPFAPGKTIKGLAREMAELLSNCQFVNDCFGGSTDEKDKCYQDDAKNKQGKCYFSNAIINKESAKEIIEHNLQENLYDIIASTKIGENGIAEDNTLREIEVVVPITLQGKITDIPQEYITQMKQSLKMIKRMGLNRNRGLGRCEFIVTEEQK
jgi:CRISPR/Cas system CSM-associated protein Csm3 (group 7 of RAMP superfamily)